MSVFVRGFVQGGVYGSPQTITWPAGTAAEDVAIFHCGTDVSGTPGPQTSGWRAVSHESYWKRLTDADIAPGSVLVNAEHGKFTVFGGASGVGRTSSSSSLTIAAGAGMWCDAMSLQSITNSADTVYRLGNEYVRKGVYQGSYFVPGNAGSSSTTVLPAFPSSGGIYSYEVLPQMAPSAPALVSPASGAQVPVDQPVMLSWQPDGVQASVQITVRPAGASYEDDLWLTSTGTLTSTQTTLATSETSASIAVGQLTTGAAYTWSVSTAAGGAFSGEAARRTVTAVARPTVSAVTVSAPAQDLTPTVSWSQTAGVGSITAHRVWVSLATATDPTTSSLWDSGIISDASLSATVPGTTPWTSGQSLKAWVQVWQSGGLGSVLVSSSAFAVTWTPPDAPTVSAALGAPPTVTVGGVTAGDSVQVEMGVGAIWTPLAIVTASGTTVAFRAPLAPFGVAAVWRARRGTMVDGVPMWSGWTTSNSITSTDGGSYLVAEDGATWLAVRLLDAGVPAPVQGSATSWGLGADGPRVDRTPVAGRSSWWTVLTETPADYDLLEGWLTAGHPHVWLRQGSERTPAGLSVDTQARLVSATDVKPDRVVQADITLRVMRFGWVTAP